MSAARVRVAFLGHTASPSGAEIAISNLVGALDGIDAHVILAEDGAMVQRFEAAGAQVEVLPLREETRVMHRHQAVSLDAVRGAVDVAGYTASLAKRLRQLRPDLVHTISLKSALYGGVAARVARVPAIWSTMDRIAPDYLPKQLVTAVRGAARVLPSAIIAISQATADTLPQGRVQVVVPAVPLLPWTPPRTDGPFRVGLVGRLSSWKGQHVFLEAFAKAFPDGDAEARLIGAPLFDEEAYEDELHAEVDRLGIADRVDFRGHRADVAGELADLDVVVHCSIIPEPFGQVVVEAMSAGRPIVAAAAGGPLEVIRDGENGLLTAPGDAGALSAALTRLAGDPDLRTALVERARDTALLYTPEAAAEGTWRVYDRVLGRNR